MSLSPAIQLLELRQTNPLYFLLIEKVRPSFRSVSTVFVLFKSSSSQLFEVFSLRQLEFSSEELSVKLSIFLLRSFNGLKKLQNPTKAYKTLLTKAQGVLIFQTVQTTLASKPMPTQLAKTFLMEFSYRWYYLQSLMSQILPFRQVSMLTSQISYLEMAAPIHCFICETKFSTPKSKFSEGHPIVRQKSLPVPMGMTPKAHLVRSSQDLTSSLSTQLMVPSPPQMMTLSTVLPETVRSFRFSIQLVRWWLSKRSTKVSCTRWALLKCQLRGRPLKDIICWPSLLPLLVFMKKKK